MKLFSQHAAVFEQADLDQDTEILSAIIESTDLTAIHGVGLKALKLVQMKSKLAQLRERPGVSIGDIIEEFDLQYVVLHGASVTATTKPEIVILFLDKLDLQRYYMLAYSLILLTMTLLVDHLR